MNTVLFDLDGTLLPMEQEDFVKAYFGALGAYMTPYGFEPEELVKSVWACTRQMMQNDGSVPNRDRFWSSFADLCGAEAAAHRADFDRFYSTDFEKARVATRVQPLAAECIRILKEKGYRLILATNPIFPQAATYARIRWAGLDPADFAWITTYENAGYCKPNPGYYAEILDRVGAEASDCLMIGNDVREDMCAAALGMEVLLLTDCLINDKGLDVSPFRQMDFSGLRNFIADLPDVRQKQCAPASV